MRGRFNPSDEQLYVCGMFAWAGNAPKSGGLYRVRRTGEPLHLPIALHAANSGVSLTFTEPLDPSAVDRDNVHVKTWSLKRSASYGSDHYDEQSLSIEAATLSTDGRTLSVQVSGIRPTWCMEIRYTLRSAMGTPVEGVIHGTIHSLAGG
jgi:hypothetical protein